MAVDCFRCGNGEFFYYGYDDDDELYQCSNCGHYVSGEIVASLEEYEREQDVMLDSPDKSTETD